MVRLILLLLLFIYWADWIETLMASFSFSLSPPAASGASGAALLLP